MLHVGRTVLSHLGLDPISSLPWTPDSSWFETEAQKTVIIGGTWYQSETTWIDQNQYYCSYKNESKLMQKDGFDYSGFESIAPAGLILTVL